ncbi:MAG: hypothetical protein GY711_20405 [bacterium]|nr:hypothetical protein [bacterium]
MKNTLCILALAVGQAPQDDAASPITHGPMLGTLTPTSVRVWARALEAGELWIELSTEAHPDTRVVNAQAASANDLCVTWTLEGLKPGSAYRYQVRSGERDRPGPSTESFAFETPAKDAETVRLAFASCADDRRFPNQPVWTRMREAGAEAVVMLGDMPYIDSTDPKVQRERYRAFYSVPELKSLMPHLPVYATWDDHDFGRNDTNGLLPEKEGARDTFGLYHANPSLGEGGEGVYTSFRAGPVEVFLLDTRWFAATEPSFVDADKPTLLGSQQWAWLKERLAASTATFKILASGMIWNGATRPFKTDHWAHYPHERAALFAYLGENKIEGVVLVGGDIHRSRAVRHATRDVVGYDLVELISSPLANFVIEAANAPHPGLLKDMGVDQSFLLIDASADPPRLTARFQDKDGKTLYELDVFGGD